MKPWTTAHTGVVVLFTAFLAIGIILGGWLGLIVATVSAFYLTYLSWGGSTPVAIVAMFITLAASAVFGFREHNLICLFIWGGGCFGSLWRSLRLVKI